jgi:hypothetical protein
MALLNRVMLCREAMWGGDLVHGGWREVLAPRETEWYDGGCFKAGLGAWQQFLLNGSPGFGVERRGRVYVNDEEIGGQKEHEEEDEAMTGEGEGEDGVQEEEEDAGEDEEEHPVLMKQYLGHALGEGEYRPVDIVTRRHVPMGGLLLIQKHLVRARAHAENMEDVDQIELLGEFDANVSLILVLRRHPCKLS